MNWSEVINQIDGILPFLKRLGVSRGEVLPVFELPPILRASASIAINILSASGDKKRVALLFPKTADCARWTAVATALAAMLDDFKASCEQLPPLSPGDRLKVDCRSIAEYVGEGIRGEEKVFKLRLDGSDLFIPARYRMRLQQTSSKNPLSKRLHSIAPDILDEILGVGALGNRSIYKSSVVLISSIIKTRTWGQEIFACHPSSRNGYARVPLINLFQWAGIGRDGEPEPWGGGQLIGAPVLVVASDMFAVENYLTSVNNEVKLIVLDGSRYFSKDLQSLDEILDSGIPALAFMESGETEDAALLAERGFEFWTWKREDMDGLDINPSPNKGSSKEVSPFSSLHRTLRNYRDFSLTEIPCSDDQLQQVSPALFELERQISQDRDQVKTLIGQLYGCMLNIARRLRPRTGAEALEWRQRIEERLRQIEEELRRNRVWLSASAFSVAQSLINELRSALNFDATDNSKVKRFKEIIARKATAGDSFLGVIVDSEDEIVPTSQYWEQLLEDSSRVLFSSASTLDESPDFDALIICGWLGAKKMFGLLHNYAAPEVYVLLNPFEAQWLKSARSRWQRNEIMQSAGTRTRLLGVKVSDSPFPAPKPQADDEASKEIDISEFELRLRFYRRQALVASRNFGEETIEAYPVEFSDGSFAFLSENYHIPVVTDYIRGATCSGEIPQKTIAQLQVGDYLLFREGVEGNLIRAVADMGLDASGKAHLRKTASLWREALRSYRNELHGDILALIQALRKAGCQRQDMTIRNWLNNDLIIGPRHNEDLEIIASVTDKQKLGSRLAEVRQAILEVRGAHLQASDFLIKKLLEAAPAQLAERKGSSFDLEIEGIGRAIVVLTEEISDGIVSVGHSRANRLLKEAADA